MSTIALAPCIANTLRHCLLDSFKDLARNVFTFKSLQGMHFYKAFARSLQEMYFSQLGVSTVLGEI